VSSLSPAPPWRHHLRQEPDAGNLLVRIRGGGAGQLAFLLRLLACAALGAWLFAKSNLEISRVRTLMDAAMLRSLSLALAKNDYGEVQETLSTYGDSGYFSQAAVSNVRQRVIAVAGNWPNVRIGQSVPNEIASEAETFDLRIGSESFGRLLISQTRTIPPQLVKNGLRPLRAASGWLSALALVAGLTLSAYLLRMSLMAKTEPVESRDPLGAR